MNVCNFIGTIGRDAELRFLPNQTAVLQFSIAVNSGYGDKQITTWINCNFFGKRAESVEQYVRKGQRIGVSGEIALRPYEKDGVQKSSLELRVNDLTLLGNKDNGTQQESQPKREPVQSGGSAGGFDDMDGDIPFADPYKGRKSYVV